MITRRIFCLSLVLLTTNIALAVPPTDNIEATEEPNIVGEPSTRAFVAPTGAIHMTVTADYYAESALRDFGFFIDAVYDDGKVTHMITNLIGVIGPYGHRWSGTYNLNAMGFNPKNVAYYRIQPFMRTVIAPGKITYIGEMHIICPAE